MLRLYKLTFFICSILFTCLPKSFGTAPPSVLTNPSACGLGLPINDFSCNANHQFPIQVTQAPGNAMGTNVFLREVRLIILHEWDADLDIHLKSPNGVIVELSTDNGSGNDNYGSYDGNGCGQYTTFIALSVAACNTPSIIQGAAPFIGTYLPEEPLNKFNDGSSPLGNWVIEICDDGKEHYGTLEFVELVFEAATCLPPTMVKADKIDSTSIQLDWLPGATTGTFIVEYGPPGSFTPGNGYGANGNIALFAGPPAILTDLLPSSTYQIFIRGDCGSGNFSSNSCPILVTTLCSPLPVTISETFDNQPICEPFCGIPCEITGTWRNVPNDHFDWTVWNGATSTTLTGPSDDVPGGGNYIYIETSGTLCRTGNEAVLMSNCIEVHADSNECDLSFNYHLYGANINSALLQATTNGGVTWQTLWQVTGNQGDQWFKQFVELDQYDGQVVQFRFVGRGGNGIRGDLGLDNINFYGSIDFGFPPFVKYQDLDGDGYGRPEAFIATCADVSFPGYVENADDCDDEDFFRNPGRTETFCDGFDENCNGDDDEYFIPMPSVENDVVCSGETGWVVATPNYSGQIYWYDSPTGDNLLAIGVSYSPSDFPENNSSEPVVLTFFAEEVSNFGCVSETRQAATITILPKPALSTDSQPLICAHELFDLAALNIIDTKGANGVLTFHNNQTANASNEISPILYPTQTATYYIKSTANGGCTDVLGVQVSVKPSPLANILGDSTLCLGTAGVLTAMDSGNGVLPLQIDWNNGKTTPQINISSGAFSGSTSVFAVKLTGANGCFSADTMVVETVTSVDAIQVNTVPVSTCNGNNGTIILSPLDGVPPFNYFWNNGSALNQVGGLTLNNLNQGAYSFTVTDSSPEGCLTYIPVVVVNGPSAVVSVENVKPVSCNGGNDGCITINVIGTAPVIVWSNGATGKSVCGLIAGTYQVTVTDGACENILTIPVSEPEALFAKSTTQGVSCFGKNDGKISLTVLGGTAPYQFLWSGGQVTQNVLNLTPGTYSATVTDARGCQVVLSPLVIEQPSPLLISATELRQPRCHGFNDGEIKVMASGGNQTYVFSWNNGGTGNTLTNLIAGNYSVSVSDSKGCSSSQSFNLPQPVPVATSIDEVKNPTCNGIDNGKILITANGGNSGYTFLWNDAVTTEDRNNLGPGSYSVVVTDQLGCTGVSSAIQINGLEEFQMEFNTSNPSCVGIDNGIVSIQQVMGGTPPYQFYWSTDESGPMINNLPAETYSVTVVDAAGCRYEAQVALQQTQPLSVNYQVFNPACHGSPTGQIVLAAQGGINPYHVEWSHGYTGFVPSGLAAGNYTAVVTDVAGCKFYTDLIALTEPAPLAIHVDNIESIACHGGDEGSIGVSVTGGTFPYNYHWSNGKTQEDLFGLQVGTYILTVTDANNCVTVGPSLEVISPDPLHPMANLSVPPGCQAVQIDSVCVEVSGGVAPFEYIWSTGDTTSCLIGISSGDYHVTITDAVGCTQELMSIKVPEAFVPLKAEALIGVPVQICAGTATGNVAAKINGGTGPFQFIWSNGVIGTTSADTVQIQNLVSGFYNVTITDAGGCTSVSNWMEVRDEGFIAVTAPNNQIQYIKCKFGSDGAIDIDVEGGLPPYNFTWTDLTTTLVFADSEDVNGLSAGTYSVLVTDALGCSGGLGLTLLQPAEALTLDSLPPVVENVSCFGQADGKVSIFPTGGIQPYGFNWNNGKTSKDIQNLGPGTYIVTLTDSNGCVLTRSFDVISPEGAVFLSGYEAGNVSCFEGNDGFVQIAIAGGTPPYFYNWNQQSVEEDLLFVPAGQYHLQVFDNNNCPYDTTFTLTQPGELVLTAAITPSLAGQSNGVIIPSAEGGVGPYSFYLDNGLSGDTLSNLAPGAYQLTVIDENLCEVSIWVQVGTLVAVDEEQRFIEFALFPNPTSGTATLGFQSREPIEMTLQVFNSLGQGVFSKQIENMQLGNLPVDLSGQPPGSYYVVVMQQGRVLFRAGLLVMR